jgi:transcriptional regulator with XRE-family HTH domain
VTDDATSDQTLDSAADRLAAEVRRLRNAAGLSQRELAKLCGYTREYVSMAERPGNIASRELVRALDTALNADGSLLELRSRAKAEQQACREENLTDPDPSGQPDMPRRTFVLASMANGLFLRRRDVSDSPSVAVPLADQLQTVATIYRNAYSSVPASQLLGAAREHFNLVLSLRPGDQPSPIRKRLLTTAGEMAALAMPVLGLNLGRWAEAGQYLEVGFRAAREAENIDLESIIWSCRAFHAAYGMGDLLSARDFADEAIATGQVGATATTRGWAAAVASERYADLGDAATSLHRLEQARTALSQDDERPWSGMGEFNDVKIVAYEGGNYSRLKRHKEAVRVLDVALDSLDKTMLRHRCTAYIDRAEAQAASGDVDAACADASSALVLAAETQHADTVWRAKKLARSTLISGGTAGRQLWQDVLAAQAATVAEG